MLGDRGQICHLGRFVQSQQQQSYLIRPCKQTTLMIEAGYYVYQETPVTNPLKVESQHTIKTLIIG